MSNVRFLQKDAMPAFLAWLGQNGAGQGETRVLVPTPQAKAIVFAPYTSGMEVTLDKASVSPKAAVLPACETLVTYRHVKDAEDLGKTTLTLDDAKEAAPVTVFGCRPCDARGFAVLKRPYTQGPHADPYFAKKYENLVVITRACTETCSTCFCHWVGSGPTDTEGSDILFTEVEGGYVLQSVTEKGAALLEKCALPAAEATQVDAVPALHEKAVASLGEAPDLSAAKESLASLFDEQTFWERQTAQCLSCGACTYICPTCYCFNITDEGDGLSEEGGKRMRTWDTCMASHFTREASGHNPRTKKAFRMRNRVSHKFSNYPTVWADNFSCNGCGRCISQCPVHLDIRSIVLAGIATAKKA